MKRLALAAALLGGCATLNTSNMSPACRDQYNACLDGCPKPRTAPDPHDAFIARHGDPA